MSHPPDAVTLRRTIQQVHRLEKELYRVLESEQAVHGYVIEDYLPLIHGISAIYNRGGTEDAIAEALTAVSDSVYAEPIPGANARDLAARIRFELRSP
jgi:hypothetical protein